MHSATTVPFPLAAGVSDRLQPRRRFRWRYLLVGLATLALVVGVTLVMSFIPGSDLRALRNAALAAAPDTWERRFELGVGGLPVFLAKSGLAHAPLDLPPEARAAIAAVDSLDVAVFQRAPDSSAPDLDAAFTRVRQTMDRRGWEPLALVRDQKDLVGVFVPRNASSSTLRACVVVMDNSDLVLVSTRIAPAPLVDSAAAALDRHGPLRLAAK